VDRGSWRCAFRGKVSPQPRAEVRFEVVKRECGKERGVDVDFAGRRGSVALCVGAVGGLG